jgi:RimK family alpha-L-glutamate ligase
MKQLKFIIIGYPNKNTLDLVSEIEARNHLVSVIPLKEIAFEFSGNIFKASWNGYDLYKADIFIFRAYNINIDEARILAENLNKKNKTVLDEVLGGQFIQNKIFDASRIVQAGLNHPRTFLALSNASCEKIAIDLKFPVVVKPCTGQKGKGIKKIDTKKEFLEFFSKNQQKYLIQDFFNLTSDIRVIVVGSEIVGAYRRFIPKNDFRSTGKGVLSVSMKVDLILKETALAATRAMGYDIAGVDLFEYDGKYFILEVNFTPQWQRFKKATGINPAKHIIDYALRKYKENKNIMC